MDFLISFMVALIIMMLVGVVSQTWHYFTHRNQMPEGWRESETQRELREAWEKEQWETRQRTLKARPARGRSVSEPALRLPRNAD
jgi:predicted Holliday junction resolvase-like endonuclease